ncbi:helix-turn-helix domain-containing protein [Desulfosporosinus sp. BICA1-9]|uniref:helix-turn-helix domain-containing protein n=1 Tax=Desulfosporosinus sp. BICA1-9 TaxID=1531958 RepID=UPI000A4E2166|nr:helix-turn-helix transcriptional regulator [Desulfosporosinus sp. BICA1-9]HBW36947.1 transcriptional regulator [Desulfosporosinus sp.]
MTNVEGLFRPEQSPTERAAYLNCSQRIYSNYERGEVDLPTGILIKLAELHNTSTDYLLNRTNRKKPCPKV